ncbi:hypothetical protein Egran_04277 [Elaphomyces granulatus]|uniref:Cytochrome P450 n=1 Tax=Elaphomyces granulatus TaxID=519963 RepID=A0A232LUX8_9EURO|nr:hypothetical protein Egran_04277 [Elaphomyces granulatus]
MLSLCLLLLLGVGTLVAVSRYGALSIGARNKRFLNGPPSLPFIGNMHQIPERKAYLLFTKWAKEYGDIFMLRLGSRTTAVLTNRRLVKELFDQKGAIYSSRPPSYISDLIVGSDHVAFVGYGDLWKRLRKEVYQYFMASMCEKKHMRLIEAEQAQMMRDFLVQPEQHMVHPERMTNSVMMSLLFGIRTESHETPHFIGLVEFLKQWFALLAFENIPPVDYFPIFTWFPDSWVGSWTQRSLKIKSCKEIFYEKLHSKVVARRGAGEKRESFLDHLLDGQEESGFSDNQIDLLASALLEAGSSTTASTILVFIQAMALNPAIQQRAQALIDTVCGEDRSPVWSDYSQLPYISMIVKESIRWRPVGPVGVPRRLIKDDWVDGKFLPAGTTVILNVWGLNHDESAFSEPGTFNPDRYEGRSKLAAEYASSPDYANRDHYGYGSGRRICPGIHLAERTLFMAVAKLLWAFRFELDRDTTGNLIPIDTDPVTGYIDGLSLDPKPFACRVTPRSKAREETILREVAIANVEVFVKYQDCE